MNENDDTTDLAARIAALDAGTRVLMAVLKAVENDVQRIDDRLLKVELGRSTVIPETPREKFIKSISKEFDLTEEAVDFILDALDDYSEVVWDEHSS